MDNERTNPGSSDDIIGSPDPEGAARAVGRIRQGRKSRWRIEERRPEHHACTRAALRATDDP